jgi:hypothetical protein
MAAIETKGDSRSRSKSSGADAGSVNIVFERTTRRGRERDREVYTGRKVASLSASELEHALRAGYEPDGEYLIGRDPREMTRDGGDMLK